VDDRRIEQLTMSIFVNVRRWNCQFNLPFEALVLLLDIAALAWIPTVWEWRPRAHCREFATSNIVIRTLDDPELYQPFATCWNIQ
jgi:hypothetical protein